MVITFIKIRTNIISENVAFFSIIIGALPIFQDRDTYDDYYTIFVGICYLFCVNTDSY